MADATMVGVARGYVASNSSVTWVA